VQWSGIWAKRFEPRRYVEDALEWHRGTYDRLRQENMGSMPHVILAKVFLLREKQEPGPDLVRDGSKDLAWACRVTQFFACLPAPDSWQTMALFMLLDLDSSLPRKVPEAFVKYEELMNLIAKGVENNSLVEMYKRQNLEPINEEKVYYEHAVEKLFVKTVTLGEVEDLKKHES
jgi:hypothetical protein